VIVRTGVQQTLLTPAATVPRSLHMVVDLAISVVHVRPPQLNNCAMENAPRRPLMRKTAAHVENRVRRVQRVNPVLVSAPTVTSLHAMANAQT